ncbi:MAG TPA: MgtC/SapB family protein [Ktedonobacterales bacterium]|nr:MgtC/SapB family protein [Ktedonobacterales bacterium]
MMISFPVMLLRLGLALILGGIVGFERERTAHTAGLRTNALVALGSALFMIISIYGFSDFLGTPHIQLDPSRIASYVVAGIGFLGGGAIAFHREQERIKGLTTAAAIWIVAALGLACGAGMIVEAVTATALAMIVLVGWRWLEMRIFPSRLAPTHRLRIEATSASGVLLEGITALCARLNMPLQHLEVRPRQDAALVELVCLVPTDAALAQALGQLQALPGVQAVEADRENAQSQQP